MKCPALPTHRVYKTHGHAQQDMHNLIAKAMKDGVDDTWRLLNVFVCGDHWHVGRKRGPMPKKVPSFHSLKYRLKQLERQWDNQNRARAATLAKIISLDKSLS
jgi:hypothetical protein